MNTEDRSLKKDYKGQKGEDSKMKKEIGKIYRYILFKNEFQGRGLRSRLPERNQKIKVEIEISEIYRKTSEFGQKHHKSEKRLEISKCWKEIRKKD